MSEQYELQGGKTKAVIYGHYPDAAELSQIYAMMNCSAFKDVAIRIMPDHHAGAGCVSEETIDESPAAYKPAAIIETAIEDTIEVRMRLKPTITSRRAKKNPNRFIAFCRKTSEPERGI
jgi:hypothetical protein